jgi:hypothetical protein
MGKKWSWIVIGLVALVLTGAAFGGGGMVWNWLLAMHGKH